MDSTDGVTSAEGAHSQGGAPEIPRWQSSAHDDTDATGLLAMTQQAGDDDSYDDMADDDLPEFASAVNRDTHETILRKERKLARAERNATEHKDRIGVMDLHIKHVRQELQHTQSLLTSKTKEVETEDHLKQLSEREIGRVRGDLRKLDDEATGIQDRLSAAQTDLHRGQEKMESFKEKMNWNQEELQQWAVASKQKEEDKAALEKYTKADGSRVKDLTLELERLEQQVTEQRRKLEKEITETQAKQIEVDKTAEDFRSLHTERQDLVGKWQSSIDVIRRRDGDIAAAGNKFASAKGRLLERRAAIEELEQMQRRQTAENAEFQSTIEVRTRTQGQQRELYLDAQQKLSAFQDEVDLLRSELSKAAGELTQVQAEVGNSTAGVEEVKAALERSKARLAATQGRLDAASTHTGKVEAVAVTREEDVKAQEEALGGLVRALEGLKEATFKQSQQLYALRQGESDMIAEISGAQASSKNLSHKIHQLDQRRSGSRS
jgi:chromosome segregation ATPase